MKHWQIRLIVVLISIALIVLIAIQLIWINNAIQLQKENFSQTVNRSIKDVVKKIEEIETLEIFIEVARKSFSQRIEKLTEQEETSDSFQFENPIESNFPNQYNLELFDFSESEFLNYFENTAIPSSINNDTASLIFEKILSDTNLVRSEEFIGNMIEKLASNSNKDFSKRLNLKILDSLIQFNMNNNGIHLPYSYKIVEANKSFLKKIEIFNQKDHGEFMSFASLLFPNDYISQNKYLVLTFDDQKAFYYKNISGLLWISLLTLSLIFIGFYYLISTIQKQKMLSEMKTDFINNMTHELKTPISTISLASEALLDNEVQIPIETTKRFGKIIFDENNRLKKHVNRILNTAMLEKSDFSISVSDLNLHELLKNVYKQNELRLSNKPADVQLFFNAKKYQIQGDELHLTNIFNNIIDNAIKYTKKKLQLEIKTKNIKNGILISIKDNGIGMTNSQQKRVFEKFYRVSTGNLHDVKGFGLGLSYVKIIVDAHGGFLNLNSELGKGSRFDIFLPFNPIVL